MANLDDLGFSSITDKSLDEGLETIRQIRQSRLTTKQTKPARKTTTTSRKKKEPELTSEQAARLLKMLTGDKE